MRISPLTGCNNEQISLKITSTAHQRTTSLRGTLYQSVIFVIQQNFCEQKNAVRSQKSFSIFFWLSYTREVRKHVTWSVTQIKPIFHV